MNVYMNRTVYRFAIVGLVVGAFLLSLALWLQFTKDQLPFNASAFFQLHRSHPMIFVLDLAPLLFAVIGALIGSQRHLIQTIERTKKEWELVFDSISDPLLVTDESGTILRCNHALVVRLNTGYSNVIGHTVADIFKLDVPTFGDTLLS